MDNREEERRCCNVLIESQFLECSCSVLTAFLQRSEEYRSVHKISLVANIVAWPGPAGDEVPQ